MSKLTTLTLATVLTVGVSASAAAQTGPVWRIAPETDAAGRFAQCVATRSGPEGNLSFLLGRDRAVGLSLTSTRWKGGAETLTLSIDQGRGAAAAVKAVAGSLVVAPIIDPAFLEGLRRGKALYAKPANAPTSGFPLTGSRAALLDLDACVAAELAKEAAALKAVPAAESAPVPAAAPAPTPAVETTPAAAPAPAPVPAPAVETTPAPAAAPAPAPAPTPAVEPAPAPVAAPAPAPVPAPAVETIPAPVPTLLPADLPTALPPGVTVPAIPAEALQAVPPVALPPGVTVPPIAVPPAAVTPEPAKQPQ